MQLMKSVDCRCAEGLSCTVIQQNHVFGANGTNPLAPNLINEGAMEDLRFLFYKTTI
jgi:hypothetical protein